MNSALRTPGRGKLSRCAFALPLAATYEFCAFTSLDGASPVPTIYGWMASNEFCHIHYTLVWAELQDLLDKSCGEILRLAQDDTGMQLRLMLIRVDNGNEQYSRDIVKATEGRSIGTY